MFVNTFSTSCSYTIFVIKVVFYTKDFLAHLGFYMFAYLFVSFCLFVWLLSYLYVFFFSFCLLPFCLCFCLCVYIFLYILWKICPCLYRSICSLHQRKDSEMKYFDKLPVISVRLKSFLAFSKDKLENSDPWPCMQVSCHGTYSRR